MFIHSVYFWFKPDADAQRVAEFEAGLRKLATEPHLKQAYFGRPENTPPRERIDASYAWGLITIFDSLADHDAYQVHPLHAEFLERFASTWQRVQIYDTRG